MTALEARALAEAQHAREAQAHEIEGARAYREYRPRIDAVIASRAKGGYTDAMPLRPRHTDAAILLEKRLLRRGYQVRWMRYGPCFHIGWGEGYL